MAVALVVGVFTIWLWKKNANVAKDLLKALVNSHVEHSESPSDEAATQGVPASTHLISKVKIMISYLQVSGALVGMFKGVTWPELYTKVLGPLQLFDLNPLRLAVPECIQSDWAMDAYGDFHVAIVLPVVVALLIGVRWVSVSCHTTTSGIDSQWLVFPAALAPSGKALAGHCCVPLHG